MPNNIKITITNNGGVTQFAPDPVSIGKGDSVFWVNEDDRGDVDFYVVRRFLSVHARFTTCSE